MANTHSRRYAVQETTDRRITVNSAKVNDWLQIAGLFGVMGSLVFVGLQLQQTQSIALSETYASRSATTVGNNNSAMGSPAFLSGMSKVYAGKADELTMPEAIALEMHVGNILTMIENNHVQYLAGFLSNEHWERSLDEVRCMMTVPLFREVATGWAFRDSFDAVIADILRAVPEGADSCWTMGWTFPLE